MTMLNSIRDYLRHPEVAYILLILAIFIVPKMLQRFRIPAAISSFALGAIAALGFGLFNGDETIKLLATLGIVSLFLHAGLDISIPDLRKHARVLIQHSVLFVALLSVTALGLVLVSPLSWRAGTLVALALVTPSTGFILDSIKGLALSSEERDWIRHKSIAAELVALVLLFVVLQSLTIETFLISVAIILSLVILIPFLLKLFAKRIAPFAPNSEFAFLIILALACAFVTKQTGTYYLVGAFLVGVAAQQFQRQIPTVASDRLIGAVELFASFFVPFYFFYSGALVSGQDFQRDAWFLAVLFVAIMLPIRILVVILHRRHVLKEGFSKGMRVSIPMLPTLVFTLVLAQLLRDRFELVGSFYGALLIYAVASSLVVSFVFKSTEPDFSADLLEDGLSKIGKGSHK